MDKPLILVTNDDGITAPGIRALTEVMRRIGDVVVVAPDKPQSGMAHAITVTLPLRYHLVLDEPGHKEFSVNGTPVDCVKLAEKILLPRKPDLIVSGINHGSNASINVLYSGTMAAVLEGCMMGVPSIGFSLCDYSYYADFRPSDPWIEKIAGKVLKNGLPLRTCLNVNIPAVNGTAIRGIAVGRQGEGRWEEEFDHRIDPRNRAYFWITGTFNGHEDLPGTDNHALNSHLISVVPVHYDLTAHSHIHHIEELLKDDKQE
jgi:5'-nucleotidase